MKRVTQIVFAISMLINMPASFGDEYYIGGGLGASHSDVSSSDIDNAFSNEGFTSNSSVDVSDSAYQVFLGYNINHYFALELGWVELGDVNANSVITAPPTGNVHTRYEAHGVKIGVQAGTDIVQDFRLFGNFGAFAWKGEVFAESTIFNATSREIVDDKGTDVYFGLGADYQLNKNFSVRGEWNRYLVGGNIDATYDMLSANLVFHF